MGTRLVSSLTLLCGIVAIMWAQLATLLATENPANFLPERAVRGYAFVTPSTSTCAVVDTSRHRYRTYVILLPDGGDVSVRMTLRAPVAIPWLHGRTLLTECRW